MNPLSNANDIASKMQLKAIFISINTTEKEAR